ncbi:stage 0 sporulation family protein [bacterium]|jgi:cell fate regulator YaaT (PSP1 superfamily)|nr:stage 0 sporulation family protein [bacterium]
MYKVVQVRLRECGKPYYFQTGELDLRAGDYVIFDFERGKEFGLVISEPEIILEDDVAEPLKKILRKITPRDEQQLKSNSKEAKKAFEKCQEKILEHKLDMKLVDVEYSFDKSKLIFYFTAEGRVDFRELVKDLASLFKTRIELRQIGVRDEAKMLGGIGCCGRTLCCATFLKDFDTINIKMAKEQRLPLNPSKISGLCGRLLCCLKYENEVYKDLSNGIPKEGSLVSTKVGTGKVIDINILKQMVFVEFEDKRQVWFSIKDVKIAKEE